MAFTIGTGTFTNGSNQITGVSLTSGSLTWFSSGTGIIVAGDLIEAVSASGTTITLRNNYTGATGSKSFTAFDTIEGLRDAVQSARDFSTQLSDTIATFGTAATKDAQTSVTDGTGGRLMLTGAGGLLGNPPLLANLNSAIADSGFYYTRVGDTGNPSAFGSAIFRNRYITTGTGSDIVIDGTGSCWYRYNNGSGSPQGFRQSWDSGSLPASPSTTAIAPNSDNTKSAGTASLRFTQVYAASGTINTSDAREKTAVSQLTQDEMNCAKQLADEIGTYQWLASIQEKGANARTHIGMTVQRAIEIFQSNNLDPFKYGIVCFDSWEDEIINHPEQYEQIPVLDAEGNETGEYTQGQKIADAWDELKTAGGNRYGFRYEQLNLFIARGLSSRLSSIEQRLQAAGL